MQLFIQVEVRRGAATNIMLEIMENAPTIGV